MKTLTTAITNQTTAENSGWAECYDFYLPSAITTPWGSLTTLRLTTLPNGLTFFTPKLAPEPSGTRGAAGSYNFWPLKRQTVRGSAKFTDDKLTITASNVTAEWATMVSAIEWRDVPLIIRKVCHALANPTADDCAVVFSGKIDSVKVELETITFQCSNDIAAFNLTLPRENMHANCRFSWGDDQCTAIRFRPANCAIKTVGSSSTTTVVKSSGLTEDSLTSSATPTELVNPLSTSAITASSQDTTWPGYAYQVRSSSTTADGWVLPTDTTLKYSTDWGVRTQGYWQIPDAQAGIANPELKPYIQFDFGSAKTANLWKFEQRLGADREYMIKLVHIYSSTNAVTWKFERHFEIPPSSSQLWDCLIHGAQSARYWRICIRTRWGDTLGKYCFYRIRAYEGNKHYWMHGTITFGAATATAALRNVSRQVLQSYNGEVVVPELPVAPASGDSFIIERGCIGTFNSCAERLNTENFGGFDSMPNSLLVR